MIIINAALLNVYFILHYHLFFRKKYFFECLYFSEYDFGMSLSVYWLRKGPSVKYVRNWWENGGGHTKRYIV